MGVKKYRDYSLPVGSWPGQGQTQSLQFFLVFGSTSDPLLGPVPDAPNPCSALGPAPLTFSAGGRGPGEGGPRPSVGPAGQSLPGEMGEARNPRGPALQRRCPLSSWTALRALINHQHGASQSQPSPLEGLVGPPTTRAAGAVTLFPAQALNPAGAGAGGEAGERKGAEPHVFARHNELPEALLVGEGIARATGTCAAHPPQTAVLGLLLLPHQLRVTDLVMGAHGKEPRQCGGVTTREKGPRAPRMGQAWEPPSCTGVCSKEEQTTTTYTLNSHTAQKLQPQCLSQRAFG